MSRTLQTAHSTRSPGPRHPVGAPRRRTGAAWGGLALLVACAAQEPAPDPPTAGDGGAGGNGPLPPVPAVGGAGGSDMGGIAGASNTGGDGGALAGSPGSPPPGGGPATPPDTSDETDDTTADETSGGTDPTETVSREWLSETGLYSQITTGTLAPGVMEYAPQFELWTDGAEKRRWVYIPEATQIDTSNIDEWKFPVGTKLWKEFTRDGIRIETRLIEKLPEERADEGFEGWLSMAYVWNDEQTDAIATPLGLEDAKGTPHDVPDQEACGKCHDMRVEKPLGFSAVQLAHDGPGATLSSLFADGWLSHAPEHALTVPGTAAEQEILGFFHANCGHCHRRRAPANSIVTGLRLWLESDGLESVEATEAYRALVNEYSESAQGSIFRYRIHGGDPDSSELMRRLLFRNDADTSTLEDEDEGGPMPPLGTEVVHTAAVDTIRSWIESLPPPSDL